MGETKGKSPEQDRGAQRVVENLDELLTNFVITDSQSSQFKAFKTPSKDVTAVPDVILVVDLNSMNPTAGFIAPSLGFSECIFLPVSQAQSKEKERSLVGSDTSSKHTNYGQPDTKNFMSHCKTLLQMKLGIPLDSLNVHISFTTRGDISDQDKAMLAKNVDSAGFKKGNEDTVLTVPTIDAVAIEMVRNYGNLVFYGDSIHMKGPGLLQNGNHMLVIHYDGDVAEIQSYSMSLEATKEKYMTTQLRLEDVVYGETVDCGKLVDERFMKWLKTSFGASLEKLPEYALGPNGKLMNQFSSLRRTYKVGRNDKYRLYLKVWNPPSGAPYDSVNHTCILRDEEIQSFFEPAVEALLNSLDRHRAGISKAKKFIDQTIFAGPNSISPYIEDFVKDWGVGAGILTSDVTVFRSEISDSDDVGRFIRAEIGQEMITEGAIRGNYPQIDVRKRSRYHYGFGSRARFETGDPEWSRRREPWDNIDCCNARITWHLGKNEDHRFGLRVYKSASNEPPKWCYANEAYSLYPGVNCVGTVSVTFSREDIERARSKICTDGHRRRKLPFAVEVSIMPRTAQIRVQVKSTGVQTTGQAIGSAVFRYE